jgi:hypothetical protein
MKKIVTIMVIGFLFIAMPIITGANTTKNEKNIQILPLLKYKSANDQNTPLWADGTFNGTWGLKEYSFIAELFGDKDGLVEIELGNISGYYSKPFKILPIRYLKGQIYPHWNHSKIINITAVYLGPYVIGKIGDIDIKEPGYNIDVKTNETEFGGIGRHNNTNFNWRIIGPKGPSFYMQGIFN